MGLLGDAFDKVKDAGSSVADAAAATAAAIAMKARVEGERQALKTLFLPDSAVDWYQNKRGYYGFEPPTLTQMPMILIAIPMILYFAYQKAYSVITGAVYTTQLGFEGKLNTNFQRITFIFIFLLLFTGLIAGLFFWIGPAKTVIADLTEAQQNIGTKTGFQNKQPKSESSYKLVNIQPLAIKQTGFVGPEEKDGIFDPALGIQTAIRSGATFFTLQIDYLEREQPTGFDDINIPTLLYRNSSGKLISKNGASINDVALELSNYVFNPDLRNTKYPIILYLHFVRTPDPITKPMEYLNFLKRVSEALQPLHSYILKDAGENFRRQKSEGSLLQLSLSSIENSIIVLCNADTTIFRNQAATGSALSPISDLDSFVNMRVYLEPGSDRIGVTQPVAAAKANAVLISYSALNDMSDADKTSFAMKGKSRFVIAMPSQLENPTYADLKALLKNTGVNAIPLNLIGTDPAPVNKIISIWSASLPYYLLKQMMLLSYTTPVAPNNT